MTTDLKTIVERLPTQREHVIAGLQALQESQGYISDAAIEALSAHFGVPLAELEGIVSFYAQFKRTRPGKYHICVCDGTACHIKGAQRIVEWIRDTEGVDVGQTSDDGLFSLETVACLGCCSLAPVMTINGEITGNLDRRTLVRLLRRIRKQETA